MNRRNWLALGAGAVTAAAIVDPARASAAPSAPAAPSSALLAGMLPGFSSRYATVNGVRLHYVIGGRGKPLFLLHGWPQTWWEYHKVMPALATRYRVIAVDLRGAGNSAKPQGGYDKKTMAADIAALAAHLGYDKVNVAGHDMGAMVAFSLAANSPQVVDKIALLDVAHPDPSYYEFRALPVPGMPFHPWWFAFNQVAQLPEQLLVGRAHYLVNWMFDNLLVNQAAISTFDRAVYAAAYNNADAIRGGNGWYQALPQDIQDGAAYAPLTVPVLGVAHDMFYPSFADSLSSRTTDLTLVQIDNTGHYFVDEQPAVLVQHLQAFFG
ncbi:alpha/beta fold hydrolase [Micromonospora sp. NPDC048871]|uniref:alpha/beta fold hydrolase n=1 Tax=unclassified Micromonospora TaxID=2617518 RepID=UPI002E149D3E|nr:alpha/beta hydrolase [Micromonospora sp. NBC_01739]